MTRPARWWREILAVRPVPVDRALVARGAVGIGVPLVLGQLCGAPALGAAAALGAYGAAVDDSGAPWRTRAQMLALPQVGGALGLALGHATAGRPWAQVVLLAVTALVSGVLSTTGKVGNTATLVWLLATAMGIGLPSGAPWWQTPLLFLLGGLPLGLWSVGAGIARAGRDRRAAVAAAFRAVADLADTPGGPAGPGGGGGGGGSARHAVTLAMDGAWEALVGRLLGPPRPGGTTARLCAALDALVEVIAALPGARRNGGPVPVEYGTRLRDIAAHLEANADPGSLSPTAPHPLPAVPVEPGPRALHEAVVEAGLPTHGAGPRAARLPAWVPPHRRIPGTLGGRLRDPDTWAFALRLTACVTVAQAVASFGGLPRSGWVVLTVALLVRPGLGTVPARLVTRLLGTLAGVALGLLLIVVLPAGWPRIAALVLLTGLLQAYARRTYLFQTFFLTPVMLLLADPLGMAGASVPEARLVDTLVGAAVAVFVGYLLWPENTRARLARHLARAHERTADYLDLLAENTENAENAGRVPYAAHALRREVHRDLAVVRAELDRLRTDPRHHTTLDEWRGHLDHNEAVIGGLLSDPARKRDPGHRRDLAAELRHRAHRLRRTARRGGRLIGWGSGRGTGPRTSPGPRP
ncbi:FUSC family protein (plasmid) [Streptomyces sp. BI20]|uniref:FUSC family protein n=1 Tax=Streptomyces sp. BI20 TaxID=3403460 RepID=UPI003C74D74D